jgi:hypothetical protein
MKDYDKKKGKLRVKKKTEPVMFYEVVRIKEKVFSNQRKENKIKVSRRQFFKGLGATIGMVGLHNVLKGDIR